MTALAERQLLQAGDVVQARYKFDRWKDGGILSNAGPADESWDLLPVGRSCWPISRHVAGCTLRTSCPI